MTDKSSIFSMLKFMFSKIKNEKKMLLISFTFLLGISFFEFKIPQITQQMIDISIPAKSFYQIAMNVLSILAFALCLSFLTYYSNIVMSRVSQHMIANLRDELYEHVLKQDFAYFENSKTGDLMTRLTGDVKALQDLISAQSLKLISNLFTFVFIYIFMLMQDVKLTLLITITFPLLYFLNTFFSKHIKQAFKKVRASTSEINNHLQTSLTSILLIKTFVNEEKEADDFHQLNIKTRDNFLEAMKYQTVFSPTIELVNYMGMAIVLLYSGYGIIHGKQTVGELVAYLSYLKMLQNPIRSFTQMVSRFQQAVVSYQRILDIYEAEPLVVDCENPIVLSDLKENISFDKVSFHYPTYEKNILNELDFTLEKGKMLALVGVSGSGKTTITKLITRLYDVSSGEIRIDNENIQHFSLSSLRQNIGMVTQEIELVDGTILDNILYGSNKKTEEDITQALKAAKLADFINSLPKGLHTEIGERGIKLSGGQKQRVAIARIFLKNAPILILDEATAALDNESEKYIQESLNQLLNDRTSLVIAHRLSTIQKADDIIVLEDGKILERGTHKELLASSGRYKELYEAQFN
ncbi:ABC transporter ATP-binding protein [Vagococcus carniphilus]|uniref:Multidrug resistance ABC transporter ATP-binding and permease protein n=1 Tax=Vagococcus carniphilus TaxID=218144 RepID=A0AAW8TZ26_9ENTE|nr:ABC transporter ATP-binding protein [Vagococcus carniphilus]MDT2830517.1 ABC transporter ATP-binding protein [Vagococcus carniphilus]MDT2832563.1 ABC transporter ATP-binding protein [Vagococcus carniphilus]MDT2839815.1 ABC transporter ATP-binding protein [Vagococcus carniphilus]MDT2849796.1 ABC transporter ATP-binding protein [Vagococcus carniphilus]MDT2854738.1 ABC transporter ATP-binding protein [Vagococcus carniphilus]